MRQAPYANPAGFACSSLSRPVVRQAARQDEIVTGMIRLGCVFAAVFVLASGCAVSVGVTNSPDWCSTHSAGVNCR